MSTHSNRPKLTYDNNLTPIEMTFITSMVRKQDLAALVDYLEDYVLWKRQHYIEDWPDCWPFSPQNSGAVFFWENGFVIALGFGCLWRSLRLFDSVLLLFLLALVWVRLLNQFLRQVIWFHPPAFACIDKHLVMEIWDLDGLCHICLKSGSALIAGGGCKTLWLPSCVENFGQSLIASLVHAQ